MRVTNVEELESDESLSVKNWKNWEAVFFSCRAFLGTVSIREHAVFVTASTCFSRVWSCPSLPLPTELPWRIAVFLTMVLAADIPAFDTICCVYNVYFP